MFVQTGDNIKWIGTNAGLAVFNKGGILGTEDKNAFTHVNSAISLDRISPDPFITGTTISYSLNRPGKVTLEILNMLGIEVAELVDEWEPAGKYSVSFGGTELQAGIYTCVLAMDGSISAREIVKGM